MEPQISEHSCPLASSTKLINLFLAVSLKTLKDTRTSQNIHRHFTQWATNGDGQRQKENRGDGESQMSNGSTRGFEAFEVYLS